MMLVLITFTMLSMVVGTVLFKTMNNYHVVVQAATWQEALLAAEGGADTGIRELRKALEDRSACFTGWQVTDLSGNVVEDSEPLFGPPNNSQVLVYTPAAVEHGGEGNSTLQMTVRVDAPPELIDTRNRQWYRIRSTGTTYLPGGIRDGGDKRDHFLRKLSLVWDRKTGTKVSQPQASRMVEVIARPAGVESALVARSLIHLNDENIRIDSFDSRSETKSTNGEYDPAKFQKNGDVATDGQIIEAGNAYIYGDVATNAGVVANGANISGEQRTDFYKDIFSIASPQSSWTTIEATYPAIESNMTLQALAGSTEKTPTRYKTSSITESGNRTLTFSPPSPGAESYIELWVTGDITSTGQSDFVVEAGVHVKILVEGNVNVTGQGFVNSGTDHRAANLQVLGVRPPRVGTSEPPVYQTRTMNISGNAAFVGVIYAPDHDVALSGGGSQGLYWGGITGKTIRMDGHTDIHYDEALAENALITDYKVVAWFEDNL